MTRLELALATAFVAALPSAAPAFGQLVPSRRPVPLPPIPRVAGPLAITVVYPVAGTLVSARDSSFLFGTVGNGSATLTVNGQPVDVAPNGAFLGFIAMPQDTLGALRFVARLGEDSAVVVHTVRLPAPAAIPGRPLWIDEGSLQPRGVRWAAPGEEVRVSVRAAPGARVALRLPDGRIFPLAADTLRESSPGTFERAAPRAVAPPSVRYRGAFPATALGAPLPEVTAREVPPAPPDTLDATVIAALGADTVRAPLPLRLALQDPQRLPVVLLSDDTPGAEATDRQVVGKPAPNATYHWFFRNGTLAAVSGREGDQVRLRLSRGSSAWVDLDGVAAVLPAGTPPPEARLALVRLTPSDSEVAARFSLSGRVPFRVDEEDRRLTVRLYGVRSDLDFIQYGGTDPLVPRVTWAQPADDECTVSLELAAPLFGWRVRWAGEDLVLEVRRPPVVDRLRPLRGRLIAVDPGHPPVGATGPTGLREAEANLAVGLALKRILEAAGARVLMTRTSDSAVGLYERTTAAEQGDAEVLVSIHNNAFPDGVNPWANNGTSTYYFHPQSAPLAMLVQDALEGEMGLRNLGVGRGDFALVRPTWMPAVLTEGAFLMIPEQEQGLRTPSFQRAYARGIALGIQAYLRRWAPAR